MIGCSLGFASASARARNNSSEAGASVANTTLLLKRPAVSMMNVFEKTALSVPERASTSR